MRVLAEILRVSLGLINAKSISAKAIYKPARNTRSIHPDKFHKSLRVQQTYIGGFNLLSLKPTKPIQKHIFFLHGGAYVLEGLGAHLAIMERWATRFGFTVHYFDYPLAPEHQFEITHSSVQKAYEHLVNLYPDAEIFLFGDSAGGGLALAFLQTLATQNMLPLPKKTALLSPWVDLSLGNPAIRQLEKKDPILSLPALQFAARQYAGNQDLKNALLSPLYGKQDNLGQILLLFGTHEIFYADLLLLQNQLEKASKTTVETYIGHKMVHDWILLPTPESKQTLHQIAEWFMRPN